MKQSTSTKTILIVAIAIVLLSASASGHDSQVVAVGAVVDDSPTTTTRDSSGRQGPREPFIPTHEWQEVDSETPLPPGLHYEIDMTTGRKRAKLLDEEDRGGATVSVKEPSISVVTKEELASRFGHIDDATLARDMEAAGMVNVVNGTVPMEGQRTLEELKAVMEELESNDVFVRDDIVSMRKCIQVILSAGATEDDINDAFLDLEDLVHQVDNGGDLDTLGGLEPLVRLIAARTTSDRLVASAALVLGSAAQSNAKVQQQAIGYGAMEALVGRVEDGKSSVLVTKRSLYALSALVRHSTEGQRQFVEGGVLEALSKAWERVGSAGRAGERVRVRMLGLIGDVLGEAVERLPEADGRRTMRQVVRGEWCGRVAVLLNGVEASYDVRDKALEFVSQALVPCLARFGGVQSDVRRTLVTMSARVERDEGTSGDDGMEALEYELAGRAVALLREMDVFCEKTGSC